MTMIPPGPQMPAPVPPPGYQYPMPGQSTGMAVAAMVLGIVSIPTCCIYGVPSLVCGILAVVFAGKAVQAIREGTMPRSAEGMARAGKICGIVGIVLSVVYWLVIAGVMIFSISAPALFR